MPQELPLQIARALGHWACRGCFWKEVRESVPKYLVLLVVCS